MTSQADKVDVQAGSVVVGVDGSRGSDVALDAALDVAIAEHRPLTIVHAVGPVPEAETALLDARDTAERRAPDLEIHLVQRVADPRDLLLTVSEHASMLVVGSRGRGRTRSAVLGSVGLSLTRHARCPVLVVRPHHPGVVRRGVLVAADGSATSTPTLEVAFQQASWRRLPLTVLHVIEYAAGDPAEGALELAEVMAGLRELYPDVQVQTELGHGRADAVVLTAADRMDLLVLGSHQGGLSRRSTTAATIGGSSCPVLVVPRDVDSELSRT